MKVQRRSHIVVLTVGDNGVMKLSTLTEIFQVVAGLLPVFPKVDVSQRSDHEERDTGCHEIPAGEKESMHDRGSFWSDAPHVNAWRYSQ